MTEIHQSHSANKNVGSILPSIQAWAKAGFYIFPVIGKKPPEQQNFRWSQQATNDPLRVTELWDEYPDANMAIACKPSGLLILDPDEGIDKRTGLLKNGEAELVDALTKYGPLPETFTVRTGNGGRHFYFGLPDGWHVEQAHVTGTRHVDILANQGDHGCYVIGPGSIHPETRRRYEVEVDTEIALFPESHRGLIFGPKALSDNSKRCQTRLQFVMDLLNNVKSPPSRRRFHLPIKSALEGRWEQVFATFCPDVDLNRNGVSVTGRCPVCGKDWKFKVSNDFDKCGGMICFRCHAPGEGGGKDGLTSLSWLLDVETSEASRILNAALDYGFFARQRS